MEINSSDEEEDDGLEGRLNLAALQRLKRRDERFEDQLRRTMLSKMKRIASA